MTNYPTGLDAFTNPAPTQRMNRDPKHAALHGAINDAVEALQAAVGVNSSAVSSSLDYMIQRADNGTAGNSLPNEWHTMSRDQVVNSSIATGTQALRLQYFTALQGGTTTNARIRSGATAAGATPTLVRVGLYTANDAGDGLALVASTVNNTGLLAAINTQYTQAWSAPYQMVRGQRYALGLLVVTAAAAPTVLGIAPIQEEMGRVPLIAAQLTGQGNLPASFVVGSLALSANRQFISCV